MLLTRALRGLQGPINAKLADKRLHIVGERRTVAGSDFRYSVIFVLPGTHFFPFSHGVHTLRFDSTIILNPGLAQSFPPLRDFLTHTRLVLRLGRVVRLPEAGFLVVRELVPKPVKGSLN